MLTSLPKGTLDTKQCHHVIYTCLPSQKFLGSVFIEVQKGNTPIGWTVSNSTEHMHTKEHNMHTVTIIFLKKKHMNLQESGKMNGLEGGKERNKCSYIVISEIKF